MGLTLAGALRGAGLTRAVMLVDIVTGFGLLPPLAYLFGIVLDGGLMGAWLALLTWFTLYAVGMSVLFCQKQLGGGEDLSPDDPVHATTETRARGPDRPAAQRGDLGRHRARPSRGRCGCGARCSACPATPARRTHVYFELHETGGSGAAEYQISASLMGWDRQRFGLGRYLDGTDPDFQIANKLEVCLECQVDFYAKFGKLSLKVVGVDKNFALGRLEARRREILAYPEAGGPAGAQRAPCPCPSCRCGWA